MNNDSGGAVELGQHYLHTCAPFISKEIDLKNIPALALLDKLPVPALLLAKEGTLIKVNQLFADIYASDALYMQGKQIGSFIEEIQSEILEILRNFESSDDHYEKELYVKGRFYNSYWRPLRDKAEQICAIMIVCAEVTRFKRRERALELNNSRLQEHLYLDPVTCP